MAVRLRPQPYTVEVPVGVDPMMASVLEGIEQNFRALYGDAEVVSGAFPVSAENGGTGIDTSGETGVAQVTSGTWSIDLTLQSAVQDNITRLGTIVSGVWNGTIIDVPYGGTNIASYAVGDLIYASGATTLSKLADVAAGSYLRSGGVTTAPLWSTLVLPNAATANQVVYATASNTWGASANLTFDGSTLAVGATVLTSAGVGDIVLPNDTGEIRSVNVAGTDTYVLISGNTSDQITLGAGVAAFSTSASGPHAIGAATASDTGLRVAGTWAPANSSPRGINLTQTVVPNAAGGTVYGTQFSNTLHSHTSGTVTRAASAAFRIPTVTLNGTGVVTDAITVWIAGAPTGGGTNKYALRVDSGLSSFGSNVEVLDVTVTGGTFAAGRIYKSATNGLAFGGITGGTYDFAFINPAGTATLWTVLTGTTTSKFAADTITLSQDGILTQGYVNVGTAVYVIGVLSPAQITSDQNNYAPTGFADAYTLRLNTDASRTITGIAGGAAGRKIQIVNIGSFDLVLADDSASSTAGNRILLPNGALTIRPDGGVTLWYDTTSSRWRVTHEG